MAIQIGKYKRPGIFLEEFDNSVIANPQVEGITNLVIGVSKKGPVNTPIRINTVSDLESVFGTLDRGLERKGSFFHRTVSKMLESSPVYAMNLLLTDDNLDKIEYQSLSTSSDYNNDIEREGAYRRFFDASGFWKRDTESFINLTKSNLGYNDRLLNLTNLSDRYSTVFIFKSSLTGFDRTLIEWYGSTEKVPTYVSPKDWASDYMVDVVIVAGDWSNYKSLALDPRWSLYFNADGLKKEQIRNFANDRNVTLLSYYEGLSLIPYFRDGNGRNIFIETTLNRDTDKTGIFCAFNNDLAEGDYFNGKIDLIGHTIAGKNETQINFLSYNETIAEEVEFTTVPLDLPGNVTSLMGTFSNATHFFGSPVISGYQSSTGYNNRTSYFAEGFVYGVTGTTASVATSSISITYGITNNSYTVIGDKYVPVSATGSLSISASDYPVSTVLATYSSTFTLDSSGAFKTYQTSVKDTQPTVESTDIVLSYVTFGIQNGTFSTISQSNVSLDTNGFVNLVHGTSSSNFTTNADYYVEDLTNGSIKVTFINTDSSPLTKSYKQYRRFKMFNKLVSLLDSANRNKMVMVLKPSSIEANSKVSLSGMTISDVITSTTQNKSFVLNTGLSTSDLFYVLKGFLCFYTVDNEFILGTDGLNTRLTAATQSFGIVAPYSKFYTQYYNGNINTEDYFYNNRIPNEVLGTSSVSVTFFNGESERSITGLNTGITSSFAGYDYILINSSYVVDPLLEIEKVISVRGAQTNTGTFTIMSDNLSTTIFKDSVDVALPANYYIYRVTEQTSYEVVNNVKVINDHSDYTHYLKMYLDGSTLNVTFRDETLESTEAIQTFVGGQYSIGVESSNTFYVHSQDSNYKQTIEIENGSTGYIVTPNKILINGSRYTEVRIGDFLEADYDINLLPDGEYPRKLTRILGKKQYSGNTSLVEVTCDSPIKKVNFNGDYQTKRYKSVDVYASTYKAISLKGFRIREASMPDGTETKQNSILNLVAKGTPLFKALTNKEALDFRYLVDSFGLGLIERSKQQLVDICGDRKDAFGFLNMPSMKSFKNSSSPSFVNTEGSLLTELVAQGGDAEAGPTFLYSFGDGEGTTCVGYFLPYLTINDNGRPLEMPPSSHVATTYMRKHISSLGGITPWTIAAGVTNGRVTNITGLEMDFTLTDIENLNGAQMNPIVFKRNRGNVIETENTAQTLYRSALSYIHVREVLIELERELSRMLLDFQWSYNTPDIRSEIKLRADLICETYVSKNGLYNYFNKMDEENNTPEIIDNQIGVLDTYVEPIKGMGIIVNNVTILRTGAIAAGGFQ